MSATPGDQRTEHARDVHEFTGWEPARQLSDEDRGVVAVIQEHRRGLGWSAQQALDERLASIEGELVPVCACGWRGYEEPWEPPGSRSPNGGQQFNSHRLNAQMTAATQRLAANTAAAALRHAAEAWTGEPSVVQWLEARANHIESVGLYDTETWPRSDQAP